MRRPSARYNAAAPAAGEGAVRETRFLAPTPQEQPSVGAAATTKRLPGEHANRAAHPWSGYARAAARQKAAK